MRAGNFVVVSNVHRSSWISVWRLIRFDRNIVPVYCNPTGFRSIELQCSCYPTDFQIDRVQFSRSSLSVESSWTIVAIWSHMILCNGQSITISSWLIFLLHCNLQPFGAMQGQRGTFKFTSKASQQDWRFSFRDGYLISMKPYPKGLHAGVACCPCTVTSPDQKPWFIRLNV